MWPTKTRREFNLQLTEELIRKIGLAVAIILKGREKVRVGHT